MSAATAVAHGPGDALNNFFANAEAAHEKRLIVEPGVPQHESRRPYSFVCICQCDLQALLLFAQLRSYSLHM